MKAILILICIFLYLVVALLPFKYFEEQGVHLSDLSEEDVLIIIAGLIWPFTIICFSIAYIIKYIIKLILRYEN